MALTEFDYNLYSGDSQDEYYDFYYKEDDGCLLVYDPYGNLVSFIKDKALKDFKIREDHCACDYSNIDDVALLQATYDGMPK
jgi:hypothetical protein